MPTTASKILAKFKTLTAMDDLTDEQIEIMFSNLECDPEEIFEILLPLGEGSFGTVFMAKDTRDDEYVALKVMSYDPKELRDLLAEISIMRKSHSPYIANFKDSFEKDGYIWIAMEFCECGSVLDGMKVSNKPLEEKVCQSIIYQTLKGLQYMHTQNLIHRDIKAANILINKKGQSKLGSFLLL